MTMPIEAIYLRCKCGHFYEDWYRGSVNLKLDNFDDDYVDECSSAKCPKCGHKVRIGGTIVVDLEGIFHMQEGRETTAKKRTIQFRNHQEFEIAKRLAEREGGTPSES